MQEVEKVINQVLDVLEKFDNALDLALLVCMMILARTCKKSCKSDSTFSDKETKKTVEAQKTLHLEGMKRALELYYSDKKLEDMTEEEKKLYEKANFYINGGTL